MRRAVVALPALVAVLWGAVPASPVSAAPGTGWEPAPATPWDVPAGARCDFPVHGEPVVDEVVRRVLAVGPDGSPQRVVYKGDLVVRVTNTDSGASHDADASGTAVVDYRADGSQTWRVRGPVLVGVAENGGNLPRGLYLVDGVYTLHIGSTGYKTVTTAHGRLDELCSHID